MVRIRSAYVVVTSVAASTMLLASASLLAQAQFQFVVSATDAQGTPVTDVTTAEVLMSENNVANQIVKVEPYRVPVKLTIAVDNGPTTPRTTRQHRRSRPMPGATRRRWSRRGSSGCRCSSISKTRRARNF